MALPKAVKRKADAARKLTQDRQAAIESNEAERVPLNVVDSPDNQDSDALSEAEALVIADENEELVVEEQTVVEPGLQVKYDDLLKRFTNLRKHRGEELENARSEVSQLKAELAQTQSELKEALNSAPPKSVLSDDDREFLGDQGAKIIERMEQKHAAEIAKLTKQTGNATEGSPVSQAERDDFLMDLTSQVPGWEKTNRQKLFNDWLDADSEHTGYPRRVDLNRADRDNDADAVAEIFNDYAQHKANKKNSASNTVVDPDVTRGGDGNANAGMVEIWSTTEVADHYAEKAALKRSGKLVGETLKRVMDREVKIKKAIAERRVEKG